MIHPDVIAQPCDCTGTRLCGDVALAVNPFVSNRYHFGMLLGVADLEAEQAYHRGKTWLHNAWLHGIGAVWGLGVELRSDRNEIVVHRGLALDGHGRELYVAQDMCVDLALWYAKRRPQDLEVTELPDETLTFTAHVELCCDACLDRPVPSISEPCEDATFDTAYSRAVERGLPRISAGSAPAEPESWYPRLSQFFVHMPVTDPLVTQALSALEALAPESRPATCLDWFRRLAAADTIDLRPADGVANWSPVAGEGCVPLAELFVHLRPAGDGFEIVTDGDQPTNVNNLVRPAHVRTRSIQELLCHEHAMSAGAGPGPGDGEAGGGGAQPRAVAGSVSVDGRDVRLSLTRPLDERTVHASAFTVSTLRSDGWYPVEVRRARLDAPGTMVTLTLASAPRARPLRVIASGAGPAPLLGVDGLPLDGVTGGPPGDGSGRNAALMVADEPPTPTPAPGGDQ